MNGYNFTDRLRMVLQMARDEAARLHHEYVGTEHLLLGLLREKKGIAAQVLVHSGVTLGRVSAELDSVTATDEGTFPSRDFAKFMEEPRADQSS